eukprot:Protomagalhaensia_sp_Gyna_25__615@NODE_128_length_5025_cov_140_328319_g101_i0_p3_GENE_NODE_128_length_5025_cov_140_328319_g101_i0NODE_128_length_5025_cov_140_328319_g101_i0_p3_ORF_typecomplete_len257_score19_35_NODE_128_length_5025_cov_140_328319_g101_i02381008
MWLWPALVGAVGATVAARDGAGLVKVSNEAAFTPFRGANCDAPLCGFIRTFGDFSQCMEESTGGTCKGKLLVRIWGTADRESFCVSEFIFEGAYWTIYVFPNVPFAHSPYFLEPPVHTGTMLTISLKHTVGEGCIKYLAEASIGSDQCGTSRECCLADNLAGSPFLHLGAPVAKHIAIDPTDLAGMQSPYLALVAEGEAKDCGKGLSEVSYAGIVYTVVVSNEPTTELPSRSVPQHALGSAFPLFLILLGGALQAS